MPTSAQQDTIQSTDSVAHSQDNALVLNTPHRSDFPPSWIEHLTQRIYLNECASKEAFLLYWSENEAFPSLGIGHFIWFPQGVNPAFEETFPQMLAYVSERYPAPEWLRNNLLQDAPWKDRDEFLLWQSSEQAKAFRGWLKETMALQSEFILTRFFRKWQQAIGNKALVGQTNLQKRFNSLLSFESGALAVVDYFNFKGLGDSVKERYQGEGWGLIQVLQAMNWHEGMQEGQLLEEFVSAAKSRLALRVSLAKDWQAERRWLPGWYKRLNAYQEKLTTGSD
ncbi:hypothetical protein [Thiomicrorhabdus sp.]|uniref:hypothetical protein n=1 Tax=Thiomicrorhabdus sp. TaxID=2039724 RepID=UPI0029C82F80|nr:hypothetical protein [Thiomicrorhabdus sp.]